ncbi:MAG: hypothetical protein ACYDBQ_03550, partial [Thermoplasmatota archaeon]
MGYAIMQILAADGVTYKDWNGQLVPLADGTLGSIVVKKVLEVNVQRAIGVDVALPGNAETTVATQAVPVGKVYKVFGYALSPDSTMVDLFRVKVGATIE